MKKAKQIKITEEDFKFIYGDDYGFFQSKILSNCYCAVCLGNSAIVNYVSFINDLDDVILRGFCAKCGGRIGRYLETGEVEEFLPRIKQLRKKYQK